ncbi:type II toxin-antitoxin system HigB family toxin [Photorhabdus cinerea]
MIWSELIHLIVSIFYPIDWLYVKFVGTHRQYDAIDANTIEPE